MALVVWLPLNGNLENQGASSITVTNHNGTVDNSGKIGKCYLLNGTNAYINGIYNATTEMSFCCWANFPSIKSAHLFDARTSGGTGYQPMYVTASSIQIGASGSNYANFSQTFSNNTWYHICVTHNGAEGKCYINGTLIGTSTAAKGANMGTCVFTLGSRCNQSNYQNAKINDVRIYNHCLSAAEVHEISQGLVLHYKLDQPIGLIDIIQNPTTYVVYNNYSSSGTTGTLTNLSETFHGSIVRREVMTPNDTSVNNFKSSLSSHGVYGHRQTFLANTKYVFWIYYRPISHTNIRVGGTASNIGGWTEIPPIAVGNGWYRVGQYRNGTVTSDKTDNIFTSFYTPTAASGAPITIDWASPHLLQGTTEIPNDDSFMGNDVIVDSSGYGYNGIIHDTTLTFDTDTARYQNAMKTNQASNSANYPIKGEINMPESSALTFSWWMRPTTLGHQTSGLFSTSNGSATDYTTTAVNMYDSCFTCCNTSGTYVRMNVASYLTVNEWHHYTLTYNSSQLIFYKDGISKTTTNQTGALKAFKYIYPFYSCAGGANRCTSGGLSDFRIYCTALSAADVKQLYEMGAKVDNKGNWHTYEYIDNATKETVTKTGKTMGHTIIEPYLPLYDKTIYTEPDGSTWIHIFHHNNPANSKFDSPTTDWLLGKYIDADRWYDVDQAIYNSLSPYEFMVKQKTTSSATETKYRWKQTANPLTATWNDVKPGTPTFITTSGYSNNSKGGLYIFKTSNLHMCIANGNNGNWYGGIGCATAYNGGIPGYPDTTVTSGYIDLYMRVYNGAKVIKDIGINANNLIEI